MKHLPRQSWLWALLYSLLQCASALAADTSGPGKIFAIGDSALWSGDFADTNLLTRLPIAGKVVHFDVTRDGQRMLYVTMESTTTGPQVGGYTFKLFVAAADGSNPQLITDKVGDPNVFIVQRIDTRLEPMFWDSGGALYPHWSSDGRRILFNGAREDDGSYPVYTVDTEAKSVKELFRIPATKKVEYTITERPTALPTHPMAMRFMQQFHFLTLQNANGALNLDPPGRTPMRPGQQPKAAINAWFGSSIHWHPDGKSLTWLHTGDGTNSAIFVRELEGLDPNNPQGATRFIDGSDFLWSPDGQFVAITRPTMNQQGLVGHQILLADRSGKLLRELYNDPFVEPRLNARLRLLAWSPDSSRFALWINSRSIATTTRIFDVTSPTNSFVDVTNTFIARGAFRREHVQGYADFSADSQTFCMIGARGLDAPLTRAPDIIQVSLPPRGVAPTNVLTQIRRLLLPNNIRIDSFAIFGRKEEDCGPIELVIPARGRDSIFAQTSEDPALAIADATERQKALADVRKRRDELLAGWNRLPEIQTEHRQRREELSALTKKPDPAAATWTPWLPTEWDLKQRFAQKRLRELETEYAQTIARVFDTFTPAEEKQLLTSLKGKTDCLTERTAKAVDDLRAATASTMWKDYFRKKAAYEQHFTNLVHTLAFAQSVHAMRLMRVQSQLGEARTAAARDGTLGTARANPTLRPLQRQMRDVYLDMGEVALRLNQVQAEAGLIAQEAYLASFWSVYQQAGNVAYAETLRGQSFQNVVFGTRALLASGQAGMGAMVDSFKRMVNWVPEMAGYSIFDTTASETTTSLKEGREKTDFALRTVERLRGLTDDATMGLLNRGGADAGVTFLETNRVFHEQSSGGIRRLVMCYETDFARVMEHELFLAEEHAALSLLDMFNAFNARVLADAKGEFGTGQKLKRLLTDPLGTARVFIQNTEFGGDHFSAPLEHMQKRQAQIEELGALHLWLKPANFDPLKLSTLNPKMYALYLELERENPDFLQWTLTRARLAAEQNIVALEREMATAEPERLGMLRQKIAFNRMAVTLDTSESMARLLQMQGIDRMMMWDYDGALECFQQASDANPKLIPPLNVVRLREEIGWQRTVETGMETAQQVGNLALQTALFEFVGQSIGQGLGMKGAAAENVAAAAKAEAALAKEFFLLRPLPGSAFADFVWKQFNPYSEFLNAWYQQASLQRIAKQGVATGITLPIQVVQIEIIKKSVLKGWCGLDDQWADFLANAIVSTAQVKPGDKHTLFWEMCVRVKDAGDSLQWQLVDAGLMQKRREARRSLSDFNYFYEMLLAAREEREKLAGKKVGNVSDAEAKQATKPVIEAEANAQLKTRSLDKAALQERLDQFLGKDAGPPGSKQRIAQIAKFFHGLKWKDDLMALKLAKNDPLNRAVDNLRRELIATVQADFFADPRFASYAPQVLAYLYIGSAGKKTSLAYKLIGSDIDFTMLVDENMPEATRTKLRDDFMTYFHEVAGGMRLEDFEMSLMVDPMPKFDRTGETPAGIASILFGDGTPQARADARANLRRGIESTIEQLIRNASDKERYLDRGNLFRHNLFVRLGSFLKKTSKRVTEEGVELEDMPLDQYDRLYGDVPLEPWMAFDAVIGNLGYIAKHAAEKPGDLEAYSKELSGKYALRGALLPMLLMSKPARERLNGLTRAEVEANGWEGAERICVEIAKEILARPDGMAALGLPTTLTVPGKGQPIAMTPADWVQLFGEWNNRKEGLPINEIFGQPRGLKLEPTHPRINAFMAENIVKTEAVFKTVLRKSIMEQGAALKQLQNVLKQARDLNDDSAAQIAELKIKEIIISQAAVWNRMSREQQVLVLKELPPQADWWAAIAAVEGLNESSGTDAGGGRKVLDRAALIAWKPRVFTEAAEEEIARRITLLQDIARREKPPELLNNAPQAAN